MLHITRPDEDEELFFMSKDIIQALMRGRSDIKIYPLYCDKYFVVNLRRGQKTPALYVDDTADLTSLVADPHQSSVVFFNLLNGITVSKRSLYNGVVSYATLVNMYDNITYDQYIRANLLDGNQSGSLKGEILDFLKLVHFSRYEKEKSITLRWLALTVYPRNRFRRIQFPGFPDRSERCVEQGKCGSCTWVMRSLKMWGVSLKWDLI